MSCVDAGTDGSSVKMSNIRMIKGNKMVRKMKKHIAYMSKDEKTIIHGVIYLPDQKPRGIVQIVHGMIEHIGRYDAFARYLTDQGFIVTGHDHLGHGRSVIHKDRWGYFAKKEPSKTLLKDIHQLRVNMQRRYPDLPYYIISHSMGSYLTRYYLTLYGRGLSGAVIMGTGFVNPAAAYFGIAITHIAALAKGWNDRSKLVKLLLYNNSYREFSITGKHPERHWLTKDVECVKRALSDPACRFDFTLNGYLGLFQTVAYTCQKKNIAKIPSDLPMLIISGKNDPVGDLGEGVIHFDNLCRKTGHTHVKMKLYEDDRHEILNETDKDVVYQDILEWLNENIV